VALRCWNATRRRSSSVKMAVPLATCNLRFSCDSSSYIKDKQILVFHSTFELLMTGGVSSVSSLSFLWFRELK